MKMSNDILKSLTTLKEECSKHKYCSECPLCGLVADEDVMCYLNISPNKFDLDLIKEEVTDK